MLAVVPFHTSEMCVAVALCYWVCYHGRVHAKVCVNYDATELPTNVELDLFKL